MKARAIAILIVTAFSAASTNATTMLIPKGNGVIVDDVSQDITCASGGGCSSALLSTLKSNYNDPNTNFYIMPDFMSITQMPSSKLQMVYDNCLSYGKVNPNTGKVLYNAMDYVLNYSALPLLNAAVFSSDGLSIPDGLGQCIPGKTVTALYAQHAQNGETNYVLPMISGSAYFLNSASNEQLITLADDIAQIINTDPNAKGVSFDLEGPTMNANTTTVFIGELAKQLAPKNKLVAIYDAQLQALKPISEQYHNVISLTALYDYGLNPKEPYAPISVAQYQTYTTDHAVPGYFDGNGNSIPVMFVTPAAATTTLYEHLNVYNKSFAGDDPGLDVATSCDISSLPTNVLQSFLVSPPGSKQNPVDYFLSQCERYINANVSQTDYFNASLNAITDGYTNSTYANKYLVGALLYNQKPIGYYALTCAKDGYNIYADTKSHKKCLSFYPENISNQEWSDLENWQIPGNN